ncbi:hypothetical protein C8Q76DRAFT_82092 [Earliella scabrosa]|nr:hypothetical protein C8Q76DRAFT_82092 [Earliella scabrosa]
MSSQDSNASLIALFSNIRSGDSAVTAAAVVLLYDYCLTFIQEIELFWMSAWTGAAVLFFMNRYITLVFKIYAFLSFAPALFTSDAVCRVGNQINTVFDMMQYIPWAGFSALRAYAMSRNRTISLLIAALHFVPIVVNGIRIPHLGGTLIPGVECVGSDSSGRKTTYDGLNLPVVAVGY